MSVLIPAPSGTTPIAADTDSFDESGPVIPNANFIPPFGTGSFSESIAHDRNVALYIPTPGKVVASANYNTGFAPLAEGPSGSWQVQGYLLGLSNLITSYVDGQGQTTSYFRNPSDVPNTGFLRDFLGLQPFPGPAQPSDSNILFFAGDAISYPNILGFLEQFDLNATGYIVWPEPAGDNTCVKEAMWVFNPGASYQIIWNDLLRPGQWNLQLTSSGLNASAGVQWFAVSGGVSVVVANGNFDSVAAFGAKAYFSIGVLITNATVTSWDSWSWTPALSPNVWPPPVRTPQPMPPSAITDWNLFSQAVQTPSGHYLPTGLTINVSDVIEFGAHFSGSLTTPA